MKTRLLFDEMKEVNLETILPFIKTSFEVKKNANTFSLIPRSFSFFIHKKYLFY
jgi:hypothetical protein